MSQTPITEIKKYPNRRLYDTKRSVYITLSDLRYMVQSGQQVSILDAKTGTDLTSATLLQILADRHADGSCLLSAEVLGQILAFDTDALAPALSAHLAASLAEFADHTGDNHHLSELRSAMAKLTAAVAKLETKAPS